MDSSYNNNFNNSFQSVIPNYNPQEDQHTENKDFQPQQEANQDTGQFNVLISNVLYQPAISTSKFDGNNLYSDLEAIDETPLDNNMSNMDLYDTDPLDGNLMSNHSQGNIFHPQSTINEQGIFDYEEPKMNNFNSIGPQVPVPHNNTILAHQNIIQSNINNIQGNSESVQPMSNVIHQNPPNAMQENQQSVVETNMTQHMSADKRLLSSVPTSSFHQNNYNPNPVQAINQNPTPAAGQIAKPEDNVEAVTTNGTVGNSAINNTVNNELNIPAENQENHVEPTETTEEPLANDNATNDVNSDASDGDENEVRDEHGEEKKAELEKCVREGCNNMAAVDPEWEDEYCSNECCIKHCT